MNLSLANPWLYEARVSHRNTRSWRPAPRPAPTGGVDRLLGSPRPSFDPAVPGGVNRCAEVAPMAPGLGPRRFAAGRAGAVRTCEQAQRLVKAVPAQSWVVSYRSPGRGGLPSSHYLSYISGVLRRGRPQSHLLSCWRPCNHTQCHGSGPARGRDAWLRGLPFHAGQGRSAGSNRARRLVAVPLQRPVSR